MVLLATVAGFTLSAFTSSVQITQAGSKTNVCYNLARQALDRLNEAVRADEVGQAWWSGNGRPLSLTGPAPQPPNTTLDGATYTSVYTVSDPGGGKDYRKVTITVSTP
jgi:type II secretory pathway pseudopilin PulG